MSQIITIPIKSLKRSQSNVRSGHSKHAIAAMAASIKATGIINPPTVTKNGSDKYEIVAGDLRASGAELAGHTEIEVRVVDDLSKSDLVALSLAENIQRVEMDDLQKFVAFDQLARSGKTVDEIAASFKLKPKEVRQSLAIGGLPKKIIQLAEKDKIYNGALEALTTASKHQLTAFLKLPAQSMPLSGWEIREWLDDDNQRMPVAHALFDVSEYHGAITDDLFARDDEARCFTDSDQFWALQNPIIDAEEAKLKKAGWIVVRVTKWQGWDYKSVTKAKGGKAYIAVMTNGQVIINKGMLPCGSGASTSTAGKAKAKPELSGPMQDYMRAHRHLAIQEALMADHETALALAVTFIITGDRGWQTDIEDFASMRNPKHQASIKESDARQKTLEMAVYVYEQVGIKPGSQCYNLDTAKILKTVSAFDRDSLMMMLAVLLTQRLHVAYPGDDSNLEDSLANLLGVERVTKWKPDEAFWSGITSRSALTAILSEFKPDQNWAKDKKSTLAQLRAAAKKLVPADWIPKWMTFPAGAYGKKHGLPFVSKKK